jgi:hypothetical protein
MRKTRIITTAELLDALGIGGGGGTFGWGSADASMGISGVSSIGSGVVVGVALDPYNTSGVIFSSSIIDSIVPWNLRGVNACYALSK